ncbi:MAG: Lantibiotic dehydratase protein [Bacteroidetes bacterium]|nr:Lantibiotic dehydratase protein [Bacteroidota bacterium]
MKLFPDILIRIGGGSFNDLAPLKLNIHAHLDSIEKKKQERDSFKQKLSDQLHAAIHDLDEPKDQNIILNLRRDIFNDKKIPLEKVQAILPAFLVDELITYRNIRDEITALEKAGEEIYHAQILLIRQHLKELASEESLQKGLLLSSQSLLNRITDYIRTGDTLKRKDLQTEQGLVKYISRMYAKTSPFSTFTNLSIGRLSETGAEKFLVEKNKEGQVDSHIRLNNFLFKYLRDLLLKNKEVYRHFLLRTNPTLQVNDSGYLFLTNSNNIESFQRIPLQPILELFSELVRENKEGISYTALIDTIISNEYVEASVEELRDYINQLIEYGFLEFNIGVSGIDPDWDIKFVEKLKTLEPFHIPHIAELSETLVKMRVLAAAYEKAEVVLRRKILSETHSAFRSVCMKLHEAAGLPENERKTPEVLMEEYVQKQKQEKEKIMADTTYKATDDRPVQESEAETGEEKREEEAFRHQSSTYFSFKPEQMFYEDTTIDFAPDISKMKIESFVRSVNDMLQELGIFAGQQDEKDEMLEFFRNKYGSHSSVSLLTFYEDYYREYKKPEAERADRLKKEAIEKQKNNLPNAPAETKKQVPSVEARHNQGKKWLELFATALKEKNNGDNTEYQFTLQDIKQVNAACGLNIQSSLRPQSYGMFAQFYTEKNASGKEELKGVLNGTFPGFGKMMSRFLHLFDEDVTQTIRKWNLALSSSDLLIEDCDASYFNANLHPPLMPYEIWMPGGHNSLPSDNQLPITDFELCIADEELLLVHSETKQQAYVFDLGFQGHGGRSQLFQLLEKFSLSRYLYAAPLVNAINGLNPKSNKTEVTAVPRILYENNVILQRKGWYVPKQFLPLRSTTESNWQYYMKVNDWRIQNKIPEEVFIFVNPNRNADNIDPGLLKKIGRDDYKPQYIHFGDPLLVNLFEKLISKVPATLRVEEMLPSADSLLEFNSQKHVTEFVVQWYNYENIPDPEQS